MQLLLVYMLFDIAVQNGPSKKIIEMIIHRTVKWWFAIATLNNQVILGKFILGFLGIPSGNKTCHAGKSSIYRWFSH